VFQKHKLLAWSAAAWFVAVVVVTTVLLTRELGWRDSRLPADEAALQLRQKLHVSWTFTCERAENDGTLLADIDYYCGPSDPEQIGWWIDSDESGVELVARTG
jgi:hypothetical protein